MVHWQSGSEGIYTLYPDGRLEIRNTTYERLVSGHGLKLNGTYTRLSGSNGSKIVFQPDGRFSDGGVLEQTGLRFREAPASPSSLHRRRRALLVSRYTLTLAYDSGITEKVGFYVIPVEMKDPVDIIRLNSFPFQRVVR